MNATSLHALIIDRHLGELAPEVSELLAEHLERNPAAQAEADRILRALSTTEQAVVQHPELARVDSPSARPAAPLSLAAPASAAAASKKRPSNIQWLARAAVFLALLAVSGAAGFVMGRKDADSSSSQLQPVVSLAQTAAQKPRPDSPWENYQLSDQSRNGGLRVVRVDTLALKKQTSLR